MHLQKIDKFQSKDEHFVEKGNEPERFNDSVEMSYLPEGKVGDLWTRSNTFCMRNPIKWNRTVIPPLPHINPLILAPYGGERR